MTAVSTALEYHSTYKCSKAYHRSLSAEVLSIFFVIAAGKQMESMCELASALILDMEYPESWLVFGS